MTDWFMPFQTTGAVPAVGPGGMDSKVYSWRHVASGVEVRRTKQEMRAEYGLKHDRLDAVVAGWIAATRDRP
jgi:hypothetical protein